MEGRVLTFSNPEVIRLAKTELVAVVGDDWYKRRQRDAEGEFFRAMSNQGPRKHKGVGGSTRQGMYVFTPAGQLLGYRNNRDPNNMLLEIQRALKKWQALPATEREPGAVNVPDLPNSKRDKGYFRPPPTNGLIIRVHQRILESDGKGGYQTCKTIPSGIRGIFAGRDHLWIQQDEWESMISANPKVGQTTDIHPKVRQRIARWHLVDGTRGEPPFWSKKELRQLAMNIRVTSLTAETITYKLSGKFLLSTEATNDPNAPKGRGYEGQLSGTLVYNRKTQRFIKFDAVVLGGHWGEGTYNRQARPGRSPLGMVFELVSGNKPADKVPPQAAREIGAYYGRY